MPTTAAAPSDTPTAAELLRLFRETRESIDRHSKQIEEQTKQIEEQTKQIAEQGKQLGGLGNKFGSFTEGLALPSMEKLLRGRYGIEHVHPSTRVRRGGRSLELDVLAYANGDVNSVYVVEVKSHLREEHLAQLRGTLEEFSFWFPEHRGKALFGIIAAVDIPDGLARRVLEEGFILAQIQDEVFALRIPDGFVPRRFDAGARTPTASPSP
jgi:hypothetical protein